MLREFVLDNATPEEGPLPMDEEDLAREMVRLGFGPPGLDAEGGGGVGPPCSKIEMEGGFLPAFRSSWDEIEVERGASVERGSSVEGAVSDASTN